MVQDKIIPNHPMLRRRNKSRPCIHQTHIPVSATQFLYHPIYSIRRPESQRIQLLSTPIILRRSRKIPLRKRQPTQVIPALSISAVNLVGCPEKRPGGNRVTSPQGLLSLVILLPESRRQQTVNRKTDKRPQILFIRNQIAQKNRNMSPAIHSQGLIHILPKLIDAPGKWLRPIPYLLVGHH